MANQIPLMSPKVNLIKTNEGALFGAAGTVKRISQTESLALALCCGTYTKKEISIFIANLYKLESSKVFEDLIAFLSNKDIKKHISYLPRPLKIPLTTMQNPKDFIFTPTVVDDKIDYFGLTSIGIIVNEGCSFGCKYCFAAPAPAIKSAEKKIVDFKIAKKFISEAGALGARTVQISGGNLFDWPHLQHLIEFAVDCSYQDIYVSIKPDRYISKEYLKSLRKSGLTRIQISMDSFDPVMLEEITKVKNAFDTMLSLIYTSLEIGFRVSVRPTILKENINGIPLLFRELSKLGVHTLRAIQIIPVGRANKQLSPSREELKLLEKEISALSDELKPGTDVGILTYKIGTKILCEGGRTSAFLFPDNQITLCDVLGPLRKKYGYDFGDVSQKSLKEIWSSPKMTRFRTLRERNDTCLACSDLKNCFGGCRAMSYAVFSDPEKLHPLCNKIHKNIGSEGEIFACWEK